MRITVRMILSTLAGGCLAAFTPPASAQEPDPSGSLGGYGAASTYASPGTGGSSPMIIPYGGMFEGFMPSRMGGGSSLAFRSRPTAVMGSARTSFSLSGGMTSGGMGPGRGGRGVSTLFGSPGGMGLGAGMDRRTPGARSMGVMPPSIGYPFRQPPSLLPSASPGPGMSM